MRKMGLFYDQAKTEVFGHRVAATAQVEFAKGSSLKLYVDGKLVDSATGVFFPSKKVPLLRSSIDHDGKLHEIEVYVRGFLWGLLNNHLEVFVDGERVARS
jgi:hypothetical protein